MRLIDADELSERCECYAEDKWNYATHPISWAYAYESFMDDIDDMRTIDAQPIVRCKDCVLRGDADKCPMCYEITIWNIADRTEGNGFCHEGRLEHETN